MPSFQASGSRTGRLASIAVAALACALVPANPVTAKEPPGSSQIGDPGSSENLGPVLAAAMGRQERLNPAVALLTEAAMRSPAGFAGLAFEGDGLTLYWKGPLTSGIMTALAAARAIGAVKVRSAPFSAAELTDAAREIETAGRGASDIQSIMMSVDGSGLLVDKMPSAAAVRRAVKVQQPLLRAETVVAAADTGVPVRIRAADKPIQFMSCPSSGCNRMDDESAWNSGDYMHVDLVTQGRSYHCTTGFGVRTANWRTYVLTAAHCATWHAGGGDNAYDYFKEYMGRASVTEDWDKDLILIDARGWYWMFDGGTATNFHKTVHSWGYWAAGEYLCQSGSTSGTVCGLRTDSYGNYSNYGCDSDNDCYTIHGLVGAAQVDGQIAARAGDSGAPVFSLDGDGVRAKGVLSAGDGQSHMLFQDMADVTASRSGPGSSIWTAVWPLLG